MVSFQKGRNNLITCIERARFARSQHSEYTTQPGNSPSSAFQPQKDYSIPPYIHTPNTFPIFSSSPSPTSPTPEIMNTPFLLEHHSLVTPDSPSSDNVPPTPTEKYPQSSTNPGHRRSITFQPHIHNFLHRSDPLQECRRIS